MYVMNVMWSAAERHCDIYFLTSLELDGLDGDLQSHILRAIHDGPNALKSNKQKWNALNK